MRAGVDTSIPDDGTIRITVAQNNGSTPRNRNRNFDETHRLLIEKAVEISSKKGAAAVSMAALARATGINRSTVYYHFDSREALLAATQESMAVAQATRVHDHLSCWVGIDQISAFVENNPDVIRAWIDDNIQVGELRQRYPLWDDLVARIAHAFDEMAPDDPFETAIDYAVMLTSALILPRLAPSSERSTASLK